ncbi:MAG: WD40 repeat domain-containing protein [Xenococcaceae cyanobacterium]
MAQVAEALPKPTLVTSKQENQEGTSAVRTLEAHHQEITLLSFSTDESLLASADAQAIVIWSLETGEVLHILPGHYSSESKMEIAPTSLSFSPDGRFLASSTWSQGLLTPEKSVIVWDVTTGKEIFSLSNQTGCRQIIFDSEGEKLYLACDSGIEVWQLEEKKQIASFNNGYPVEAITLSSDGKVMATADANITDGQQGETSNQIKLWEISNNDAQLITTLEGHTNNIAQLAFTAQDKRLASSSYDGEIKIWQWQQGKEDKTLTNNSENGLFSLNSSGRLIAGNFSRGMVLNVPRGAILETPIFVPFQGKASAVNFSPDGKVLAWATNSANFPNPTIVLWQIRGKLDRDNSQEQVRDNYRPLVLNKVWGESSSRQIKSIGSNIEEIALSAFGLLEKVENETETVEVDYPQENKAVVTISQINLADDSVAGIRYRVEFAPYGSMSEDQVWRVIWAGQQYKCRSNRGHQDWAMELCQ